MQNLTTTELSQISESYSNGLKGIEDHLSEILNCPNLNNLITKKTKHLARIDLQTVKSMLRGTSDVRN